MSRIRETSPDPLIITPDTSHQIEQLSPIKTTGNARMTRYSNILRESSPNVPRSPSPVKQQRTIIFNTPTKSRISGTGIASSPFRIKVTVEAEPNSQYSGPKGQRTATRKVPLKGEDESVPVKRKRTPRKSISKESKEQDTRSPAKRPRGRPRKSLTVDNVVEGSTKTSKLGTENVTDAEDTPDVPVSKNLSPPRKDILGSQRTPDAARAATDDGTTDGPASKGRSVSQLKAHSPIQDNYSPYYSSESDEDEDPRDVQPMFSPSDDTAMLDRSLAESEGFTMVSLDSLRSRQDGRIGNPNAPLVDMTRHEAVMLDDPVEAAESLSSDSHRQPLQNPPIQNNSSAFGSATDRSSVEIEKTETSRDRSSRNLYETSEEQASTKRGGIEINGYTDLRMSAKRQLRTGLRKDKLVSTQQLDVQEPHVLSSTNEQDILRQTTPIRDHVVEMARLPTPADTVETSSSPLVETSERGRSSGGSRERNKRHPEEVIVSQDEKSLESGKTLDQRKSPHVSQSPDVRQFIGFNDAALDTEMVDLQNAVEDVSAVVTRQDEASQIVAETHVVSVTSTVQVTKGSSKGLHRGRAAPSANDVWMEEANSSVDNSLLSETSRPSRHPAQHSLQPPTDFRDLLDEDDRPQRPKLPRSWRRTSGNHFLYSDEAPSPVRPNPLSLFEQDLQEVSNSQHADMTIPSIERDMTPAKALGSSPEVQSVSQSSKIVRFGTENIVAIQDTGRDDEQYYSSDASNDDSFDASGSESEAGDDVDATFFQGQDTELQELSEIEASHIRQLRREMPSIISNSGPSPVPLKPTTAPLSARSSSNHNRLKPDPQKQYTRLFDTQPTSFNTTSRQHQTFKASTQTKTPKPPHSRSQSQSCIDVKQQEKQKPTGIFTRLSTWLYSQPSLTPQAQTQAQPETATPTTKEFSRNHFYLLEHHWKKAFPTPDSVLQLTTSTSTSNSTNSSSDNEQILVTLSPEVQRYLGHTLHSSSSLSDQTKPTTNKPRSLTLKPIHLQITQSFITEALQKGIPMLSDGHLERQRGSPVFPMRGPDGKVVRVKEKWEAWDVLRNLYGLWVCEVETALALTLIRPVGVGDG